MSEHPLLMKNVDLEKFSLKIVTEIVELDEQKKPCKSRGVLEDDDLAQALVENDKDREKLEMRKIPVITDGNKAYTIGETRIVLNEAEMRVIVRQAVDQKLSEAEKAVVFKKT